MNFNSSTKDLIDQLDHLRVLLKEKTDQGLETTGEEVDQLKKAIADKEAQIQRAYWLD